MKNDLPWPGVGVLRAALAALDPDAAASVWLEQLVLQGLDRIPLPASGRTLERWQALAAVAQFDLSLAKLYEGHTDALANLAEIGDARAVEAAGGSAGGAVTWGVWAAEAPQGRTNARRLDADAATEGTTGANTPCAEPRQAEHEALILDGAKCWCSGAGSATHALLTAWLPGIDSPQLVALDIRQTNVSVDDAAWRAVGMGGSASLDVRFTGARAIAVGRPGDYLSRAGFWQGGAGIAACWYGGTLAIADALRAQVHRSPATGRSPFRLAALGKVDVSLRSTAAVLREAAEFIDAHPLADARPVALRARLAAEASATFVLDEAGRALGATPFCRDARFARMAADLPVFIRQSHAERDFAALAEALATDDLGATGWPL